MPVLTGCPTHESSCWVGLEAGWGRVFRFATVAQPRTGGSARSGARFRERFRPKRGPNRSRPVPLPAVVGLKGGRERFGRFCCLLAEGAKTLTRSVARLEAVCGPGQGLVSGAAGSNRRRHSRVSVPSAHAGGTRRSSCLPLWPHTPGCPPR